MDSTTNVNTGGGAINGSIIGGRNNSAGPSNIAITGQNQQQEKGVSVREVLAVLRELGSVVESANLPEPARQRASGDLISAESALKEVPPDIERAQTFVGMLGLTVKRVASTQATGAVGTLVEKSLGMLRHLLIGS